MLLCHLRPWGFAGKPGTKWAYNPLPIGNLVNQRSAYAEPFRNLAGRKIVVVENSDRVSLKIGQFGIWGKIAAKIHKAALPLAASVFGKRNPFKVTWDVIRFVAIQMVNGRAFKISINKRSPHKPVDTILCALAGDHDSNLKIPVSGDVVAKYFRRTHLNELTLNHTISLAAIDAGCALNRAHPTPITDFQDAFSVNAGLPNLCGFHGIYIAEGQL